MGVEVRRQAKAGGQIDVRRVLEQRAVGTQHDGQVRIVYAEAFDQRLPIATVLHVEHGVGMAVARQKTLQSHQRRFAGSAGEQGAATVGDQRRSAQKECTHDDFADLGRPDDQGAQMGRVETQRLAARASRTRFGHGGASTQLAHFAGNATDGQ